MLMLPERNVERRCCTRMFPHVAVSLRPSTRRTRLLLNNSNTGAVGGDGRSRVRFHGRPSPGMRRHDDTFRIGGQLHSK